ncbi:hypothetical protein EK21DRAFT_75351, partial [Setomelanomma holmii]
MSQQSPAPSALPEGLRYYLLRNLVMVPLVPVDQLPFQIQGVPRHLAHRQMSDENWKLLQETDLVATPLSIQAPSNISSPSADRPRFLAPDYCVRAVGASPAENRSRPGHSSLVTSTNIQRASDVPRAAPTPASERSTFWTDSFAAIYPKDAQHLGYRMPCPSGIEPDPSKKEFCTHWIRTGECAFTSVGCKYKHKMPEIDKLRELGFTQQPKWWKEKSAIATRGPTWLQRHLASGGDSSSLPQEVPSPRALPDPSTFKIRSAEARVFPQHERERDRDIRRREAMREILSRSSSPAPSKPEASLRCESQVSNLLIDLDEPAAPLPSPQLWRRSST